MKIQLMLCCNNPDNGLHTGVVDRIDIDHPARIELEGPPVSCYAGAQKLELDGLIFDLKFYQNWVGNWCWDCATLESVHVIRILNHLREKGWDCIEAEVSLWDKWYGGEEFTVEDLEGNNAEQ